MLVSLDIKNRGQVFTPENIVLKMRSLLRNQGRILEPSCGGGAFMKHLPQDRTTGIELQPGLCPYDHLNMDFFDYPVSRDFDSIIGNPPYVRYQDIEEDTQKKLDSSWRRNTNLYLFFIHRCLDLLKPHGELIFITPRDFIKQTSARSLNKRLSSEGGFTHFEELGDQLIFESHTPNCVIWRWQKGFQKSILSHQNGQFMKADPMKSAMILGDVFDIKVGAVSGADAIFNYECEEAILFACSQTRKTGQLKKMIYNRSHHHLLPFKQVLMGRKIKQFHEQNWWQWGRKYTHRSGERIYVNCRTRQNNPFFISNVPAYDGSLLALFPKSVNLVLSDWQAKLNATNWGEYGFKCGGRFLFSQSALANFPIK